MRSLNKELDQLLLDLAWSLWTELGVAGVRRNHQKFLIAIEELILLTVALMEIDPRLRDEVLDWCSQYHRFFSISRLKFIMKSFGSSLDKPFSQFSATLNSHSQANWPVFIDSVPLKLNLSRKSCLRPLESPALLNIRARSLFGVGARADIITFFLTHGKSDFSATDVAEIGYSKRNIIEVLEGLTLSNLFDQFLLKNRKIYRLAKNEPLLKTLKPIPDYAPAWRYIFEVLLSLRDCIKRTENCSESTQVIEIRNVLLMLHPKLQRLNLVPPPLQKGYHDYLNAFRMWLLELTRRLAEGNFPDKLFLKTR